MTDGKMALIELIEKRATPILFERCLRLRPTAVTA